MQQRLRVGVDTLRHDLVMAGAGAYAGSQAGTLNAFFASVQPKRIGCTCLLRRRAGNVQDRRHLPVFRAADVRANHDFAVDAGNLLRAQGRQSARLSRGRNLCGFEEGMQVLLYDETGSFDPLTITQVQDNAGHLQRNQQGPLSKSVRRRGEDRPGRAARLLP